MQDRAKAPSTRAHALVGSAAAVVSLAALLLGPLAFAIVFGALGLVAFLDMRRLLGEPGHPSTLVLGGAGVAATLWTGYAGELELVPAVTGALVLLLLVTRVVLNEIGSRTAGVVADLSATLGAVGVVGVLGAHVLLVRSVPRFGFRGLLALGLMAVACDVVAFAVGRLKGRRALNRLVAPTRSWEGALAGVGASIAVGLVVGLVLSPPFGIWSGLAFGAGVAILVVLSDVVFAAIKRSAGMKRSGTYLGGAGGVLDLLDGILFAAPAFYWAFRTIAL